MYTSLHPLRIARFCFTIEPRRKGRSCLVIIRARFVLPLARPPIEDGAVMVTANHIRAVGPWRELQGQAHRRRVVDLRARAPWRVALGRQYEPHREPAHARPGGSCYPWI